MKKIVIFSLLFLFPIGLWAQDTDGKGIPTASDNCQTAVNPLQTDTYRDDKGDMCDPDDDGVGILDFLKTGNPNGGIQNGGIE